MKLDSTAFLFVGVLFAACGDMGGSLADARTQLDATTPSFDATTPSVDAARTVDARPDVDGAVSADAAIASGPASILVLDPDQGLPDPSVTVLFENPDGTITTTTTNSDGVATATVVSGASATVVEVTPNVLLQTIEGVQPGDTLTIGQPEVPALVQPTGTQITVSIDAPEYDNATDRIELWAPECLNGVNYGTPTFPISFGLLTGCATTTFVLLDYDDSDPTIERFRQYIIVPSQSLTDGQQISVGPWVVPDPTTITFSDIPSSIIVDSAEFGSTYSENFSFGGSEFIGNSTTYQPSVMVTGSEPLPGISYAFYAALVDGSNGAQYYTDQESTVPTVALDVGELLLPWIEDYASYNPVTRTIQWTQNGNGNPDATTAACNFSDSNGDSIRWEILAPATSGALAMPHLPNALSQYEPLAVAVDDQSCRAAHFATVPSLSFDVIRMLPLGGGKQILSLDGVGTAYIESVNND